MCLFGSPTVQVLTCVGQCFIVHLRSLRSLPCTYVYYYVLLINSFKSCGFAFGSSSQQVDV